MAANLANLALEVALVYGLDAGVAGSAWATVAAQAAAAAWLAPHLLRAPERPRLEAMRPLLGIGADLLLRTAALLVIRHAWPPPRPPRCHSLVRHPSSPAAG